MTRRVDAGLKPSCEIVCPTQAIISGDLDDPDSEVSRLIDTEASYVRAPEQGTSPKLFYIGIHQASINPLAVGGGDAYLTTEVAASQCEKLGPLTAGATATVMADVAHPPPWGWRVVSYFLTKGIAAGAIMLARAPATAISPANRFQPTAHSSRSDIGDSLAVQDPRSSRWPRRHRESGKTGGASRDPDWAEEMSAADQGIARQHRGAPRWRWRRRRPE